MTEINITELVDEAAALIGQSNIRNLSPHWYNETESSKLSNTLDNLLVNIKDDNKEYWIRSSQSLLLWGILVKIRKNVPDYLYDWGILDQVIDKVCAIVEKLKIRSNLVEEQRRESWDAS